MKELLNKLLAADILTEDTKLELEAAVTKQLDEALETARAAATAQVTAEINEQWITEREILIEALDTKVTEVLTAELDELKEDINRFRDLEAEYAVKLVEAKSEMAEVLKSDMAQLIEKMDAFLEVRLTAELEELREDFEVVKRNQWGKNIFEAFVAEFKQHYAGDDSAEARLTETEQRLEDALVALEESERKTARLDRTIKLEKVLTPLSGRSREVMEAILKNIDTPLLEEAYSTYVGRVVKESSVTEDVTSEKETKVLAEGKKAKVSGIIKSGNDEARIVTESAQDQQDTQNHRSAFSDAEKAHLRKVAGIA